MKQKTKRYIDKDRQIEAIKQKNKYRELIKQHKYKESIKQKNL